MFQTSPTCPSSRSTSQQKRRALQASVQCPAVHRSSSPCLLISRRALRLNFWQSGPKTFFQYALAAIRTAGSGSVTSGPVGLWRSSGSNSRNWPFPSNSRQGFGGGARGSSLILARAASSGSTGRSGWSGSSTGGGGVPPPLVYGGQQARWPPRVASGS